MSESKVAGSSGNIHDTVDVGPAAAAVLAANGNAAAVVPDGVAAHPLSRIAATGNVRKYLILL
ncbi:hypothetical protein R3Q06_30310 [Rhodococcus erythropolis]|uniref:hypothetical protein n=1 Tax=Rhodococcus erythropolis TaxID=1833 RepID=UPI00294A435D|nr:hypothetical protein [Rhodococcus erythropolis]MDV6277790.1 hypothetical protein [Rhodococcus erythropolis]